MEKQPHLNLLKIAGGISTLSGISHGLFYLLNKFTKATDKTNYDKLTPWLERHIEEVHIKLKENKSSNKFIKKETLAFFINLLSELEEFLYLKNCQSLEEKRLKLIETPQQYQTAVFDSLKQHEIYFIKAKNILKTRLGINFTAILDCVNNVDMKEFKILLEENQKQYDHLPKIDKEDLKKAYIVYSIHQMHHEKVAQNLFTIAEENDEYLNIAIEIHNMNKYLLKDTILLQFGFNEKYFYQLLKINNLLNDSELKKYVESLIDIKTNLHTR